MLRYSKQSKEHKLKERLHTSWPHLLKKWVSGSMPLLTASIHLKAVYCKALSPIRQDWQISNHLTSESIVREYATIKFFWQSSVGFSVLSRDLNTDNGWSAGLQWTHGKRNWRNLTRQCYTVQCKSPTSFTPTTTTIITLETKLGHHAPYYC